MKLLIDEMWPPVVAEGLRRAGYDAVAVSGDPTLVGHTDEAICALAGDTRRAVVTENAADFLRIVNLRAVAGETVPTLVVTSNRSFPRHSRTFVGRAVRALGAFCAAHPGDDPQTGAVHWLHEIRSSDG